MRFEGRGGLKVQPIRAQFGKFSEITKNKNIETVNSRIDGLFLFSFLFLHLPEGLTLPKRFPLSQSLFRGRTERVV